MFFLKWDGVNMSQLGALVNSTCNIFKYCFFKDMIETFKISEGSNEKSKCIPSLGTYTVTVW
jgi:hypothetical protein